MKGHPLAALLLAVATAHPGQAQAPETAPLPETDLVAVSIAGSLNLRAGPTTDAERLVRLDDGTLLRRIDCQRGPDDDWCEVEMLDGSLEGWAAARFLRPWYGADPAALESPAIAPDDRLTAEAPGRFASRLEPGGIVDLLLTVPAGRPVTLTVGTADSVGTAVFAADGGVIDAGRGAMDYAIVLVRGTEVLVRFADLAGQGADWALDVALD